MGIAVTKEYRNIVSKDFSHVTNPLSRFLGRERPILSQQVVTAKSIAKKNLQFQLSSRALTYSY